jgi:hypothetical protein
MLVRWPGRAPERIYSSGRSMFSAHEWQWYVASSYTGLAVSYGPYFEVRGPDYRLLSSPDIRSEVLASISYGQILEINWS